MYFYSHLIYLHLRETPSDYYYDMEFLAGYQTADTLDPALQMEVVSQVTKRLADDVYCLRREVPSPTAWLTQYLSERVLPKLPAHLSGARLSVNGVEYPPALQMLAEIPGERVGPRFVCPIHGDLSLENIMWNPVTRDAKLIDNAGCNYIDSPDLDLGKLFQHLAGGYSTWNGKVRKGEGGYEVLVPSEHAELRSAGWLARYEGEAYYKGLYWMAIHFIRFLPFQEKRSADDADFALQSYLLAVMALGRVHRHMSNQLPHYPKESAERPKSPAPAPCWPHAPAAAGRTS
jgi:hypothetical protein